MISIVNRKKKCSLCGIVRDGLLFKNMRLERLMPVFLCYGCLDRVRDIAGEPVAAALVESLPDKEEKKNTGAGADVQKSAGQEKRKEEGGAL